jgi:2-(3-amino-3-carboxypropyl)histidine synthase
MPQKYDLEIGKIVREIKLAKAKLVCIQLPDGLKPKATQIADELTKKTRAKIHIWLGSNFGACDIPLQLKPLNFDLIVNFGHSKI